MAINKANQTNIDKSDLADYPNGQIKDDDGTNNGTPVARVTMSDIFEFFDKLMRLAGIAYNGNYDNEGNNYQYIQALQNLANKNDIVQSLTAGSAVIGGVSTPILIIAALKLETLAINEVILAVAVADYDSQVKIKGATPGTYFNVSSSAYLADDVLLIKNTPGGFQIVTLCTTASLVHLANEAGYLMAADDAEELAGSDNTVATTPETNLLAFITRVNGADSDDYVATESQNGLMSKNDKIALDGLATTLNRGWFSGLDVGFGAPGATYATHGDIVSAVLQSTGGGHRSQLLITFANPMPGAYKVRSDVEQEGSLSDANDCFVPVFAQVTDTTFQWQIAENMSGTQAFKIHLEVIDIS